MAGLLIFLLLSTVPCWAHAPEAVPFKAFQFPVGLEPVIDGEFEDWSLVGQAYRISSNDLHDLVGSSQPNDEDFYADLMVGWSATQNRLYFAAQVRDDIHQIDRSAGTAATQIFLDDAFQLFIDADHSGGQFANFSELSIEEQNEVNGTEANHFILGGPPPDGDFFVSYSSASWYALPNGPYTQAALVYEGEIGGAGVTRYEVSLVPFDKIDVNAAFQSVEHRLSEGEIVGFNVEFDDFDLRADLLDAKWSLSGELNSYRFSERFADLMLMPLESIFIPTAIEEISWGAIKQRSTRWSEAGD
ncbi:MAG: hypothetical protein ACPHSD_09060 [Candidatus Latescibacterota bacterium]